MLAVQLASAAVALSLVALAPPAQGLMLLVPLGPTAQASMLPLAIDHGARLVGRGLLPGSIVVRGRRAELTRVLVIAGILTFGAPPVACGAE